MSRRPGRTAERGSAAAALAIALAACSSATAAGDAPFTGAPDPVVIPATQLAEAAGRKLGRLALMAVRDGAGLAPIPFQVDEKTVDGASFVYPGGKEANPEAGNGRLDGHDELVFMASDCGAALAPAAPGESAPWPLGAERAVEIAVQDPGGATTTGYVYLVAFADTAADPPRSTTRYVDYHPNTETVTAASYAIGYEAGKDRIYFSSVSVPASAGGTGQNFVDRLKMRTQVETKLFFSIGFDEGEWDSTVAAYLDGPVRAIRQVKNTLAFVGIQVAPTIVVEATYYRDFHVAPTAIHQTVNFPSVASAAWFDAEIDLGDAARGMRYYRPRAGSAGGGAASPFHAIDGVPSADEKELDPRQPPWHLVTGAPGTMMWLMELPHELVSSTDLAIRDDAATPEPPETVPGTIGELVYHIDLMPLPVGDYQMRVFYFFPPRWKPGDEARWLRMTTRPLGVSARGVPIAPAAAPAPPVAPPAAP